MKNTALLVIDMQNAYFNNETLAHQKIELVEKCNELIDVAKQCDVPIFVVRTEHEQDGSTWTLNMLKDQQGYLFAATPESASVDGLDTTNTFEIIKTRDSAFFGTTLANKLQQRRIKTIILCGVSTHSCIMQTAMDAYAQNIEVVLAKEAIASHDPAYHDRTFKLLNQEYRQQAFGYAEIRQLMRSK